MVPKVGSCIRWQVVPNIENIAVAHASHRQEMLSSNQNGHEWSKVMSTSGYQDQDASEREQAKLAVVAELDLRTSSMGFLCVPAAPRIAMTEEVQGQWS